MKIIIDFEDGLKRTYSLDRIADKLKDEEIKYIAKFNFVHPNHGEMAHLLIEKITPEIIRGGLGADL